MATSIAIELNLHHCTRWPFILQEGSSTNMTGLALILLGMHPPSSSEKPGEGIGFVTIYSTMQLVLLGYMIIVALLKLY